MSLTLYAGRPGTTYDDAWWQAVHVLFDEAFPGLPRGIARAAAVGADWRAWTTPFALFEGERCVAHVGVLSHPCRVAGQDLVFAGVHAVCTATDHRRRGHSRTLQEHALAWADRTTPLAKLSTDDPPVYTGQGFRTVPTWIWTSALDGVDPGPVRPLNPASSPEDLALLVELLARRVPASEHFATLDDGWLALTDAALLDRLDRLWVHLPDHDCAVAVDEKEARVLIVDVIGPVLPPAEVVVGAVRRPGKPVRWQFAPDRFEPSAAAVRVDAAEVGHFMVRGTLPEGLSRFGISSLWEH